MSEEIFKETSSRYTLELSFKLKTIYVPQRELYAKVYSKLQHEVN